MALADIYNAVKADLADANLSTRIGSENIGNEDAPPRMIWVPTADTFIDPVPSNTMGARWPRPIKTRLAGVEIHIWGAAAPSDSDEAAELRAAEALITRVLFSINSVAKGSYTLDGGSWVDASSDQNGREYVLAITFALPVVPETAQDPTAVTTFTNVNPMQGTQVNASIETTGEPAP